MADAEVEKNTQEETKPQETEEKPKKKVIGKLRSCRKISPCPTAWSAGRHAMSALCYDRSTGLVAIA
jgi:hypothetical protein